jgi:hypothetical protein
MLLHAVTSRAAKYYTAAKTQVIASRSVLLDSAGWAAITGGVTVLAGAGFGLLAAGVALLVMAWRSET